MNVVMLRHYVIRYENIKTRAVIESHAVVKCPGLSNPI